MTRQAQDDKTGAGCQDMLTMTAVQAPQKQLSIVGRRLGRVDGEEKVSGRAEYVADVLLPGMLWGAVLRSPYPHARIVKLDASRARGLAGVRAVVTADETP